MSNEIALFSEGSLATPDYLKTELDATTKSLMGGGTHKRISIEGGVYRMVVGGKEVAKNVDRKMKVIIIHASESNARTFYEGTYKKGQKTAPTCHSSDGERPHSSVKNPQAQLCAHCPQNIKGSGTGDSRACRYSRRLAVLLENDPEGNIYGLSIPAQSLFGDDPKKMGLQQYARFLGGHGLGINTVVTTLEFDTDSSTPKLMFSAARPLTQAEYAQVKEKKNHPDAQDAVNMTVAQQDGVSTDGGTGSPAQQPASPAPQPQAQAAPQPSTGNVAEPVVRNTPQPKPTASSQEKVASILQQWADD